MTRYPPPQTCHCNTCTHHSGCARTHTLRHSRPSSGCARARAPRHARHELSVYGFMADVEASMGPQKCVTGDPNTAAVLDETVVAGEAVRPAEAGEATKTDLDLQDTEVCCHCLLYAPILFACFAAHRCASFCSSGQGARRCRACVHFTLTITYFCI